MITSFKLYENSFKLYIDTLKVGDWIIDNENDIGEIVCQIPPQYVEVDFDNLDLKSLVHLNDIVHHGTEDEMKFIYNVDKYNL